MKLEKKAGICMPCQPINDENLPPNLPFHHAPSFVALKMAPIQLPEAEGYRCDIETYVLSLSEAPSLPVNYFPLQQDLS